jgi:heterotetrameric sarcosine oxidase gamma subunit
VGDTGPVARSPITPAEPVVEIAGWLVSGRRSSAALTLTDCTPLTKVAVRAAIDGSVAGALDVPLGRARRAGAFGVRDVLVVGAGPGEWLVLAAPGQQRELIDGLGELAAGSPSLASVVDLTSGRAAIRLDGEQSADLLAKECALDLGDRMCPNGTALRSGVAGVATDIVRDDRRGTRSFLLHCERSSGQYLFDALLDAGSEFGVDVDGFVLPGL